MENNPTPKKVDTYSYKGWMNSDFFWKRVFGVMYYYGIASVIVSVVLGIIGSIVGAIVFHFLGSYISAQGINPASLLGL